MEDNTVVRKLEDGRQQHSGQEVEDGRQRSGQEVEDGTDMELAHHLKSNNKSNDNTEVIDKDKGSCEQKRN